MISHALPADDVIVGMTPAGKAGYEADAVNDDLSATNPPHPLAPNDDPDTLATLRLALLGQDDTPREISPLSWLHSLIEECRRRGPAVDDEDPAAYFEMLRECEALLQGVDAALAGVRPDAGQVSPRQSSCGCPKAGSW